MDTNGTHSFLESESSLFGHVCTRKQGIRLQNTLLPACKEKKHFFKIGCILETMQTE